MLNMRRVIFFLNIWLFHLVFSMAWKNGAIDLNNLINKVRKQNIE